MRKILEIQNSQWEFLKNEKNSSSVPKRQEKSSYITVSSYIHHSYVPMLARDWVTSLQTMSFHALPPSLCLSVYKIFTNRWRTIGRIEVVKQKNTTKTQNIWENV